MIVKTELIEDRISHKDTTFYIRQLSTSRLTTIAMRGKDNPVESMKDTFVEAVYEWAGVESSPGVAIECTPATRAKVYECNPALMEKVMPEISEKIELTEAEQKKI